VSPFPRDLTASQAVYRLGISRKALLLYERHGLIEPHRSPAGWRLYGPDEMVRASAIVELRSLGLSLAEVKRVLDGDTKSLDSALSAHQARLRGQIAVASEKLHAVSDLRAGLADGHKPVIEELDRCLRQNPKISVALDLPWPWNGERLEFSSNATLIYIVGPLGSGKTRLAEALARAIPGAIFVPMQRDGLEGRERIADDPDLAGRVETAMRWLMDEGASDSPALLALLVSIENEPDALKVIDMVEHDLDESSQLAVAAWLKRPRQAAPIFAMTRSSAILDLAAVGAGEAILFCPANHSPPFPVEPRQGAMGYEAVETCLATPEVRARTSGTIAWRPTAA
jgi:DNA-binding transcriptional MerR regulator